MTNKFFGVFLKTINPLLAILFVICVFTVFSMDMWLNDITSPYKFFVALGKFNYGIAVSYIAAFVFYLITVHYPETKACRDYYQVAEFPASALVTNVETIFIDMAKKLGDEISSTDLNDERISSILRRTKCLAESTLYASPSTLNANSRALNWLEYLRDVSSTLKSFQEKLAPLFIKLDAQYVGALSQFIQDEALTSIINMVNLEFALDPTLKSTQTFGDGLEEMFIEKYHKALRLKEIIAKRNKTYGLS